VFYTLAFGGSALEAFRQRLRELGYDETKNIAIDRFAEHKVDRLPHLVAKLIQLS
jgi:hypothetical protein